MTAGIVRRSFIILALSWPSGSRARRSRRALPGIFSSPRGPKLLLARCRLAERRAVGDAVALRGKAFRNRPHPRLVFPPLPRRETHGTRRRRRGRDRPQKLLPQMLPATRTASADRPPRPRSLLISVRPRFRVDINAGGRSDMTALVALARTLLIGDTVHQAVPWSVMLIQ